MALSAVGTADPDGDALTYEWFVYPEAGTYPGEAKLAGAATAPADAAGTTIHVVLAVRDAGSPALATYRRVVVTCGK